MSLARALRLRADDQDRIAAGAATRADAAVATQHRLDLLELRAHVLAVGRRLARMADRIGCPPEMRAEIEREMGDGEDGEERGRDDGAGGEVGR